MQLIDIIPRQIHFLFDFPVDDLKKIKFALDHSELRLDLSNSYDKEVDIYITEVFYKTITETLKGVEGDKS